MAARDSERWRFPTGTDCCRISASLGRPPGRFLPPGPKSSTGSRPMTSAVTGCRRRPPSSRRTASSAIRSGPVISLKAIGCGPGRPSPGNNVPSGYRPARSWYSSTRGAAQAAIALLESQAADSLLHRGDLGAIFQAKAQREPRMLEQLALACAPGRWRLSGVAAGCRRTGTMAVSAPARDRALITRSHLTFATVQSSAPFLSLELQSPVSYPCASHSLFH